MPYAGDASPLYVFSLPDSYEVCSFLQQVPGAFELGLSQGPTSFAMQFSELRRNVGAVSTVPVSWGSDSLSTFTTSSIMYPSDVSGEWS